MPNTRRGRHRASRIPLISRRLRYLASAFAALGLLFGNLTSSSASAAWEDRTEAAITMAESMDSGSENAFTYAFLAGAIAEVRGWDDPDVQTYLDKVYDLQLPSGGYGLGVPYDAFQNGSVNPADTTYTITVTGQVGRVLLDGYIAGAVPKAKVEQLVQVTLDTPRSRVRTIGTCLSYSWAVSDGAYCVPNITASAGKFLTDAWDAGVRLPGQLALMSALTQRDASVYFTGTGFWPYMQGLTTAQDWNHNAVNVEAELQLSPAIGQEALGKMMALTSPASWIDPLAKVVLLPYSCGHASGLLDDFDAILGHSGMTASLAAQAAYWAGRAASHC